MKDSDLRDGEGDWWASPGSRQPGVAAFGSGELRMRLRLQDTQANCVGEVKAIRPSGSSLCLEGKGLVVWDTCRESKVYVFFALDRDQGLGGGTVAPLPMA